MDRKQAAEIYRKAADIIDKDGWAQGHFFSPEGGCCATGALMVAGGFDKNTSYSANEASKQLEPYYQARNIARYGVENFWERSSPPSPNIETEAVKIAMGSGCPERIVSLVGYNDEVAKEPAQVTALLRYIATRLEQEAA